MTFGIEPLELNESYKPFQFVCYKISLLWLPLENWTNKYFIQCISFLFHSDIWEDTREAGIESIYIYVCDQMLLREQCGGDALRVGKVGKFKIKWEVKQGYPISPIFFNCATNTIFKGINCLHKVINVNGSYKKECGFLSRIMAKVLFSLWYMDAKLSLYKHVR